MSTPCHSAWLQPRRSNHVPTSHAPSLAAHETCDTSSTAVGHRAEPHATGCSTPAPAPAPAPAAPANHPAAPPKPRADCVLYVVLCEVKIRARSASRNTRSPVLYNPPSWPPVLQMSTDARGIRQRPKVQFPFSPVSRSSHPHVHSSACEVGTRVGESDQTLQPSIHYGHQTSSEFSLCCLHGFTDALLHELYYDKKSQHAILGEKSSSASVSPDASRVRVESRSRASQSRSRSCPDSLYPDSSPKL